MICEKCKAEIPEQSKFCTVCGAEIPPQPVPEHLENGITVYEGCWTWDGTTAARRYPAIFTAARWTVGILGGLAMLLILLLTDDALIPLLITAAVTLGIYLLTAGALLLIRGGKFELAVKVVDLA